MTRMTMYAVGADPEMFIVNGKTGKVVSAIGMIPGKKGDPYKVEELGEGFGLETDCILCEFNIPPSVTKDMFVDNITDMQDYVRDFVKGINPDYDILCKASMPVDEDQLTDPQAHEIGCEIDYNVYTEQPNIKPKGYPDNTRVAGFHIHCGYPHPNIESSLNLVRLLDFYLGIPSVLVDHDKYRRSLYGRAGNFRLKDYGVEYRTLSSAMMANKKLLEMVYTQVMAAFSHMENFPSMPDANLIRKVIDDSDEGLARRICNSYDVIDLSCAALRES